MSSPTPLPPTDPTAGPGSPEENDGHHSWFTSYEERELLTTGPKLEPCLEAGRAAYLAAAKHGDVGTCGFAWVVIEITPETKPAIRWLNEEDHGRVDSWHLDFRIGSVGFLHDEDERVQSLSVEEAGCEALAAALREAGCPCRVDNVVD